MEMIKIRCRLKFKVKNIKQSKYNQKLLLSVVTFISMKLKLKLCIIIK